jgi:hypothetical protein
MTVLRTIFSYLLSDDYSPDNLPYFLDQCEGLRTRVYYSHARARDYC